MKPLTNYTDPLDGATSELMSAMSALNMEPSPIPGATGIYLSERDRWAKHSVEHMQAAFEQIRLARLARGA